MGVRTTARRVLDRLARLAAPAGRRRGTKAPAGLVPNDAPAWEEVYGEPPRPVREVTSEIARHVLSVTQGQKVLLEAGVGTGSVSAELAVAGKDVVLFDFSERILSRACRQFEISGLARPRTILGDLTKPLELEDRSVDTVWSSGTLEHWTPAEAVPILREMARVSAASVLAIVPRASCLPYRWGKSVAEREDRWPYGREIPRDSLVEEFARAGMPGATETTLAFGHGLGFLGFVDRRLQREIRAWWDTLPPDDPLRAAQAALLSTLWRRPARPPAAEADAP